jgi:acetolactate synthase I/II/III large subunit
LKVSDYIASFLYESGVRQVFGCTGGAVTHLIDSIFKDKRLEYIHSYHEQAAAFSASALAKYRGTLGVAIATSGPGATNLITGIADAYFDSAPALFLTGQVNTYDFKYERPVRQCGFQETDIVSMVKPITKYSLLLDRANNVEHELQRAVEIALSDRPGPVLLDIPMDIQRSEIFPHEFQSDKTPITMIHNASDKDVEFTLKWLSKSKKPVILAGGGCRVSKAKKELTLLAEMFNVPVAVSLLGKDSFPNDHPLFAGFVGAYGNRFANLAVVECDLLIAFGSRLDSRQIGNVLTPFLKKEIIQVDLEPDPTDQRFPKRTTIRSDVKDFIQQLLCKAEKSNPASKSKWVNWVNSLKIGFPPIDEPKRAGVETFHYEVMNEISKNLAADDVVCVDIGQNQMLAAQVLEIKERQRFITSGGMAPMGYALPASISIAIAKKGRVIMISGDGGMQLNIHELNTVGKLQLPILMIVFDNRSLGMIKQFQDLYFNSRYCDTDESSGYNTCDFTAIAKSYGINGFKTSKDDAHWKSRLKETFSERALLPMLIQVEMNFQTHIFPKLEFDKPLDKTNPKLLPAEEKKLKNKLRLI